MSFAEFILNLEQQILAHKQGFTSERELLHWIAATAIDVLLHGKR